MDDAKMIDKISDWRENGNDSVSNALKATVNKWNEIQEKFDDVNETMKMVCEMCLHFNGGECENCVLNDESLLICNSDKEVYSLYNEVRKAGNVLMERISEMVFALSKVSYSDAYKRELRYEAIQKGEA